MTAEDLKQKSKGEILTFIRERLSFRDNVSAQLRYIDAEEFKKEHRRFDMSGYEDSTGDCTKFNLSIVNEFAYLGIYDYTSYLFLDFYKGTPTLYLKYFNEDKNLEFDFTGWRTTEIIHEILKLTIFSDKPKRRRH